jgi:protein-glutamine gamma-glutamyltransferase
MRTPENAAVPGQTAPTRTAADWLVAAAILVVLPLFRDLPIWVSAGYLGAVTWRFMHTHWHWHQAARFVRWALALGATILVYRHYGTLLGREPGIALLVLLTGFKLLELGSLRDAALAAMLLLLIILGSFLFNSSLLLGVYTLGAVLMVTAALVRLQHPALAPARVIRFAAVIVAQALPLMLVAYLLFPRLPDALWGLPSSGSDATTGIPDQMRPGNISALNSSDVVAFRAYFDDALPPARDLYWRVRVFWDTDGSQWEEGGPVATHDILRVSGPSMSYRLVIEPNDKTWLPVLDMPTTVPADLRRRAGFVYETRRLRRERQTFDFVSHTRYQTGAISDVERERALALPPKLSERVRHLAQTWRANSRTDAATVRAAMTHFNQEPFVYTMTPPALGSDVVDEFLFKTQRGFCEHYAAAFVTLMRAAGIPARVVIGYQGGVYNPTGNYLIVRQADAHAWAEVWLSGVGWARVDPTAAVAPSRIEYGIDGVRRLSSQGLPLNSAVAAAVLRAMQLPWFDAAWLRTRLTWDYINFSWYLWVGDYSLDRQTRFLAQIGLTEWSVPVMVLILAQLILLYALIQLRRRRPPRRRDILKRHYEKYCRKLARIGIERRPEEGPFAFAERALAARPDLAPIIKTITERYVALRYGALSDKDGLRLLARSIAGLKTR